MLEIGKSNEVKFKVNVNGTSATPSVRLVIETPEAELGFSCNQGDGYWFTSITLPDDLTAGDYPFRVEVVLNNKLFTPIKKTVTIARASEIPAAPPSMETATTEPARPTQTPDQTRTWESEGGALPVGKEVPHPLPPEKPTPATTVKLPTSLMKEVVKAKTDTAAPPKIKNLQPEPAKIDRTPKKPIKRVKQEAKEPIRIKISDIVAESNARFDKVLKESPSYRKPGKAVTPINIQPQTPVFLMKEEVVYE